MHITCMESVLSPLGKAMQRKRLLIETHTLFNLKAHILYSEMHCNFEGNVISGCTIDKFIYGLYVLHLKSTATKIFYICII